MYSVAKKPSSELTNIYGIGSHIVGGVPEKVLKTNLEWSELRDSTSFRIAVQIAPNIAPAASPVNHSKRSLPKSLKFDNRKKHNFLPQIMFSKILFLFFPSKIDFFDFLIFTFPIFAEPTFSFVYVNVEQMDRNEILNNFHFPPLFFRKN
jgi:hypothetical protein